MAIDSKYGSVTTERGTIADDEPVVVFRAQDKLLPLMLRIYYDLCDEAGSPDHHLIAIDEARHLIEIWQEVNTTKIPSSDSLDPNKDKDE